MSVPDFAAIAAAPLASVVKSIESYEPAFRDGVANQFCHCHPERLDYRLFRAVVISSQIDRGIDWKDADTVQKLGDLLITALGSLDHEVTRGARFVLSRLKINHINELRAVQTFSSRLLHCVKEGRPLGCSTDALLLENICIPHVTLMLLEEAEHNLRLRDLQEAVDRVTAALNQINIRCGEPLPIQAIDLVQGAPWPWRDTALAVSSALIEIGNYYLGTPDDDGRYPPPPPEASLLVQTGWLTCREVLKRAGPTLTSWPRQHIRRREIQALYTLGSLDQARLNTVRAAISYSLALHQRKMGLQQWPDTDLLTAAQVGNAVAIASRAGLSCAGAENNGAAYPLVLLSWPSILRNQPALTSAFRVLERQLADWDGLQEKHLRKCIDCATNDDDIRAALRLAIKSGNLKFIRDLIQLRTSPMRRLKVRSCLDSDIVLLFANAVASVQQKAIAFLKEGGYWHRAALRKMWKSVPRTCFGKRATPAERESRSDLEHLFIHHVINGLALNALEVHPFGNRIRGMLFETAAEDDVERIVDDFSLALQHTAWNHLTKEAFTGGVTVNNGDLFVSMQTRDGAEVSVILMGPHRSTHEIWTTKELADDRELCLDWSQLLRQFADRANDKPGVEGLCNPDEVLQKLICRVLRAGHAVSPGFSRLLLHCPPMFRAVPWMYALMYWSNVRAAACHHRSPNIIVLHVAGVHVPSLVPDNRMGVGAHGVPANERPSVVSDDSDEFCKRVATTLQALHDTTVGRTHHLSLVFHGRSNGVVASIDEGQSALLPQQMKERFLGWRLAIVHCCESAFQIMNKLGDIGAIPGFLLGQGTDYVLASPLRPTEDAAIGIEKYICRAQPLTRETMEASYIKACAEVPATAIYNLYARVAGPTLRGAPWPR